ncbi:MAG TPA: hypothetical protein VKZ73_06140 [Microbacterium sp.]|nr:hypothetical protein [Microbacterium sp.]
MTDVFAAESAPRVNPLSYPGAWPASSVVITHDALRAVDSLEDVDLTARAPVLAIGSNAAPSQLRHKFATVRQPFEIVSMAARVSGYVTGYCAFVAPYGYVPATIVASPGAWGPMALQFLTDVELAEIDATEAPWYKRVWIEAEIRLDTGELLAGAYAYVARGGYLADAAGPWLMRVPEGELVVGGTHVPDQRSLFERLTPDPLFSEALGTCGGDPRTSARAMRRAGVVCDVNPLYDLPDEVGSNPRRIVVRERAVVLEDAVVDPVQ